MRKLQILSVCAVLALLVSAPASDPILLAQAANPCGMQLNQAPVVFCETFSQAFPVTNRAGQLDGVLWGASRTTGNINPNGLFNAWSPSTIEACNGPRPASPVGATDIIVCDGQLRESLYDNHTVLTLALYPKQPFDFTGRTGTVSFDVTNDTTGTHGAWPEFWLSDKPVPAPFTHFDNWWAVPQHGFGLRFHANAEPGALGACPNTDNITRRRWTLGSAVVVRDFVVDDTEGFGTRSALTVRALDCVVSSSGPNGGMNHVELRMSQGRIDVYATDAGTTAPLKHIAEVTSANLSATRGLVWIEHSHYNADKSPIPSHVTHTFSWDNVAFDGPPTYRDLSFDVLDRGLASSGDTFSLGWPTTPTTPANLTTLPMTAANIAAATGAHVMFNYSVMDPFTGPAGSFTYRINGHAHTAASPHPPRGTHWGTMALPVPLSDLVAGAQSVRLSGDRAMMVTNVNVVLVNAAPVPGVVNPPPPPPTEVCGNGIDDDLDGQIDEGCATPPPPPPAPTCTTTTIWQTAMGNRTFRQWLEDCVL